MNLSSGGLAILVVGVLWFLVLLPSFIKGETGEKREYKEDSIRRAKQEKKTPPVVSVVKADAKVAFDSNSFQPSEIPNQGYLKTGAIEIVELADVVSIEKEKPEIDSIDEILRRRRHVG